MAVCVTCVYLCVRVCVCVCAVLAKSIYSGWLSVSLQYLPRRVSASVRLLGVCECCGVEGRSPAPYSPTLLILLPSPARNPAGRSERLRGALSYSLYKGGMGAGMAPVGMLNYVSHVP